MIKVLNNSFVKNSFYLYLTNFFDSILLILILPFVARIFGPTIIGEIGLAQSIGLIYLIIIEYGFNVTATKKIAIKSDKDSIALLIGQIYSFKLLLIPLIILSNLILIYIHPLFSDKPLLLLIVTFDAFFQGLAPTWYFKGIQKFKYLAYTKVTFRILALVAIFNFVNLKSDSWIYLLLLCFSSFLIALFQIIIMLSQTGKVKLQSIKKAKPILKITSYNFLIYFLPTLFNNIGIFILSYFTAPIMIGYYYAISKIHRGFNTLYTPIFESFFPYIAQEFSNNEKKALSKMTLYSLVIFLIGITFFSIIIFFSSTLISIFLGEKYLVAENFLKAFGALLPLTVISYTWGNQWMVIVGKEKIFSRISILSNIVGIICLIILVPKYLIYAIPMAIGVSEIIKIIFILRDLIYDN